MKKTLGASLSFFALFLLNLTPSAKAVTNNWNVASGDFGTAGNWNPAQVPTSVDWARVNNNGVATIADGLTYSVSNFWVGARNIANSTGTVQITSGTLSIVGAGNANNRPQIGVGVNALGRVDVAGGTLDRPAPNFMYVGGNGGRGFLTITSGNIWLDSLRVGSDNDLVTGSGVGTVEVNGGLFVVTNQVTIGRDREIGIVNINSGEFINLASNYLNGVTTDDFLTIGGGNNSTGTVTVAAGGTLRAEGGIRMGQAAAVGEIADATLRINGGKLVTQRLFQGNATGTSLPKMELDGGIIEAVNPTNAQGFIYENLTIRVKAGGITIDSAGYDLLVGPGFLADSGSPGGGITKSNVGLLKLLGTNTYTGPTVIQGGGLLVASASSGGGAVTANDGAGFGVAMSAPSASLAVSSLSLNAGAGTNDLNFALGLGNPTAPCIIATTLNVSRTNIVNLSGAGLAVGQITLIQYTSAPGLSSDQFQLGVLPVGVSANLVFEPNRIKLNITGAPSLHWNGNVSVDWDTNTPNWLDFSTPIPTATVFADGFAVQFDDGATTNYVNLVQALAPASLLVSNNSLAYTFAGPGSIVGATGLSKRGSGTLTVGTLLNDYAGDTVISQGTFQLGVSDVIPQGNTKGNVIVDGTLDMNGWNDGINGLSGNGVIDNTSANPANLTVGNAAAIGSFSGTITNSAGPLTLTKLGNNVLRLTGTNSHSGGTTINNGFIQAANDYVLGVGTLTLTTANGPGLYSEGSAARTFTNPVVISEACSFGNAIHNGFLTFTGPVDFNAGTRNVTFNNDVLWSGGSANGGMNKRGTGTLTLQGAHTWTMESDVQNGTVILDGAAYTNTTGFRPNCNIANGTARLRIGPGSLYVLDASGLNLRVGATGGNTTATNIAEIEGTLIFPSSSLGNGRILFGQGTTIGFANLRATGLAIVNGVSTANSPGYCEFNFEGGTLQARTNSVTFMVGLSNAFVRAAGGTIDTAGFDVTIAQNLLDGGGNGGLTKIGGGALFLNGLNTYTGSTLVNGGALGGNGAIAGPVTVTAAGTLAPGTSIGVLTVNNTLTLQGSTLIEVSRDGGTATSDRAFANTLNRGGSIVVTNIGSSRLQSGDVFDLFDWVNVGGSFTSITLPPLWPGLSWDTNNFAVDGTIRINGTETPLQFATPLLSNGNLVWSGSGGAIGGTYYVLTSPDVSLSISNFWVPLTTNQFDGSGNFIFSEAVDPGTPARFYVISTP